MNERFDYTQTGSQTDTGLRTYILGIYNYMATALGITAVIAYFLSQSSTALAFFFTKPMMYVTMFAPFVFVMVFQMKLFSMSARSALLCLYAYSAMMGISLSGIIASYLAIAPNLLGKAFLITTLLFGSMSLYGYTTKKDLTSIGSFLIMGMWGIFLASMVNMFMQSPKISYIVSYAAVVIFTGLIAYDTQKLKSFYYNQPDNRNLAIMGALHLYMLFINLFITILNILGRNRD
jgi:uncharacterized protein